MSGYVQFASTASKYKLKQPTDILPIEKASLALNITGFFLQRARIQVERLLPVLDVIHETIPKITEGPQVSLNTYYNRISCLSGILSSAGNEIDKYVPDDLKCSEVILAAFGYLGQFNQYLPTLVSPKECKNMISYIPALLECIETVVVQFKKLLDLIPKCELIISNQTSPINFSEHPLALTAAAILYITEETAIDLNFLLQDLGILGSAQVVDTLKQWLMILSKFSGSVFQCALQDPHLLINAITTVTAASPSLLTTVGSIQSFIESPEEFQNIGYDAIILIQQLNTLEALSSTQYADQLIKAMPQQFIGNANMDQLGENAGKLYQLVCNKVRESAANDSAAADGSIKDMLQFKSSNPEISALAITNIVRNYSYSSGDLETGEKLLFEVGKSSNDIISSIFARIKTLCKNIQDAYSDDLGAFAEKDLGELNYYAVNILQVGGLSVTDSSYCESLKKVISCFGSLPRALRKIAVTVDSANIKQRFGDFANQCDAVIVELSTWTHQVLLSFSSVVVIHAELAHYTLSFCQSCNTRIPDSLLEASSKLKTVLFDCPRFLSYDLGKVKELIEILKSLPEQTASYCQSISSSTDKLLILAASVFPLLNRPLPQYAQSLSVFMEFPDAESFSAYMNSVISSFMPLFTSSVEPLKVRPSSVASRLGVPISQLFTSFSAISANKHNEFGETLSHFREMLSPSVGSIWPAALELAAGLQPSGDVISSFAQHQQFLSRMLNDIGQVLDQTSRPFLQCALPESVKLVKQLETKIKSLPSNMRQAALDILEAFKGIDHPDVIKALKAWFAHIDNPNLKDAASFSKSLKDALQEILRAKANGKDIGNDELIDAVMGLSASLAMTKLDEPYDTMLKELQKQLIQALKDYLLSDGKDLAALKRIHALNERINAILKLMKMSAEERDEFFRQYLQNCLLGLNTVRARGEDASFDEILQAISALESALSYLEVTNTIPDLRTILRNTSDSLIAGTQTTDQLNEVISRVSHELLKLRKFSFDSIYGIKDIDTCLDLVYNRAELFRKCSNTLLKNLKDKNISIYEIVDNLKTLTSASNEGAGISFQSLFLAQLKESPVASQAINTYGDMTGVIASLIPSVLKYRELETEDTIEIRRNLRKMAKQFDTFINIIEAPQKSTDTNSGGDDANSNDPNLAEFEKLKMQVLAAISDVSSEVASINWLSTNSFSPEMFNEGRDVFTKRISARFAQLTKAGAAVLTKAVGDPATMFDKALGNFKNELGYLLYAAQNVNFTSVYPADTVVSQSQKTGEALIELTKLAENLLDHIVVKPDPEAAGKLPDDYALPSPPESTSATVSDAMSNLKGSHTSLLQALETFVHATSSSNTPTDALLASIEGLKSALDRFIGDALIVMTAARDPHIQLQLQTALHSVASAFTSVKDALRSRLMRADKFESEMEESIVSFRTAVQSVMNAAEAANEVPQDDSNKDEVTRELEATANAIEEMARRLKSIELSNMNNNMNNNNNIEAQEGTLAAYVISNSNPILAAAAQILKRAQQITHELMQKFGKIENSQLLIRSAKELSDAAALLIFSAEIVVRGETEATVFKVIAAAKIVKASVSALVAQVLVKGGDPEQIMNMHVRTVVEHTDKIIEKAEGIVLAQAIEDEKKVKKAPTLMATKLNLQTRINEMRVKMQEEEQTLYKFRKRF